jgi:hypothetical protein
MLNLRNRWLTERGVPRTRSRKDEPYETAMLAYHLAVKTATDLLVEIEAFFLRAGLEARAHPTRSGTNGVVGR